MISISVRNWLLPAFILLSDQRRASDSSLMVALALVVLGVVLYRWDVNLSGLFMAVQYLPQGTPSLTPTGYHPTWVEWATTAGVLAYGLAAFTLGVRYLPVFKTLKAEKEEKKEGTDWEALPTMVNG